MRSFLKVLLVGILTALTRALGQMLIPDGAQTVLQPAVFTKNGTMPIAFMIYGVFAYSIIGALYLLIENKLSGHRMALIVMGLLLGLLLVPVPSKRRKEIRWIVK